MLATSLLIPAAGAIAATMAASAPSQTAASHAVAPVVVLPLRGAIGPASVGLVARGIARAQAAGAQLLVLQMDTPGGLDLAMRDIIQAILGSPVPIATYVYPGGARAASAGTYILYASHIAAMAPGTNLGAASPVRIGLDGPQKPGGKPAVVRDASAPETGKAGSPESPGSSGKQAEEKHGADEQDVMTRKQMHDASAYLRGLAELRGRNADWAERAVRESVSLPAAEAAAQHVVDVVAPDLPALLRAVDGRTVEAGGVARKLQTAQAPVIVIEPDWRSRLLAVITDPGIALILVTLGIYGLIYEFSAPGMVLPGVAGGIFLLLGMFALQMLPVNYAGLALLVLGIGCMIAEAFLPSFGALGIGGAIAFAFGAVMLIDTDAPGFGIPLALVGTLATAALALSVGISALALRTRRQPVVSGDGVLVGAVGEVVEIIDTAGDARGMGSVGSVGSLGGVRAGADAAMVGNEAWVLLRGERWRVHSRTPVAMGERIRVTGRSGLTLEVDPEPAPHNQPAVHHPGADTRIPHHGA